MKASITSRLTSAGKTFKSSVAANKCETEISAAAGNTDIQTDGIRAQFTSGAFWSTAAALSSQAGNLAVSLITARQIGRTSFGEYGLINSTVSMFAVFATLSMGVTAMKYVAELKRSDPERAGRIIQLCSIVSACSGLVLAVVIVYFAPWLASNTINAPRLSAVLQVGAASLIFAAINGSQLGVLAGFGAFKAIATVNFLKAVVAVLITAALVPIWHLSGAVWALTLSTALGCILNRKAVHDVARSFGVPLRARTLRPEMRLIWSFSVPAFLSGSVAMPATWVTNTSLVNHINGYAEMGLFSAANQWRIAVLFLPTSLAALLVPLLAEFRHDGPARQRRFLKINIALSAGIAALAAVFVSILAPMIMRLYGREFSGGQAVLLILATSCIVAAPANVLGQFIVSRGRMWLSTGLNITWAVLLIVFARWSAAHGAIGLAGAYLMATGLHFGLMLACLWGEL